MKAPQESRAPERQRRKQTELPSSPALSVCPSSPALSVLHPLLCLNLQGWETAMERVALLTLPLPGQQRVKT